MHKYWLYRLTLQFPAPPTEPASLVFWCCTAEQCYWWYELTVWWLNIIPSACKWGIWADRFKVVTRPPSDDLRLFKNSEFVTDKESCMKYYRMSFHVVVFFFFITLLNNAIFWTTVRKLLWLNHSFTFSGFICDLHNYLKPYFLLLMLQIVGGVLVGQGWFGMWQMDTN